MTKIMSLFRFSAQSENVTARGERLELLVNKTENLRDTSVSFRKTSRNLARAMFWNNIKMYVIVGLVLLFIVYVIVSMFCGGLLWQECVHKNWTWQFNEAVDGGDSKEENTMRIDLHITQRLGFFFVSVLVPVLYTINIIINSILNDFVSKSVYLNLYRKSLYS